MIKVVEMATGRVYAVDATKATCGRDFLIDGERVTFTAGSWEELEAVIERELPKEIEKRSKLRTVAKPTTPDDRPTLET